MSHSLLAPASISPIPTEAADWLRTHFDWTFGAVWVACERFAVNVETVVAWAERLRAGGARAGLGTKERTWILAQLTDPEQQPTAVERGEAQARLSAHAERHTERHEEQQVMTTDTPAPVTTSPTASSATVGAKTYTYPTREAQCGYCGKTFTARQYSTGWTTYCSASCGAKARYAASQANLENQTNGAHDMARDAVRELPPNTPQTTQVARVAQQDNACDVAPEDADDDDLPTFELLRALIDRLPTSGMWSEQQRGRWVNAFLAALDLDVWVAEAKQGAKEA